MNLASSDGKGVEIASNGEQMSSNSCQPSSPNPITLVASLACRLAHRPARPLALSLHGACTYAARPLLGNDSSGRRTSSSLFTCAICQVDLEPSEGISVHAGSIFSSSSSKPWEGPFLCSDCRDKKDAMEGKRPSGVKVL
uniref:Uncharacterized protein n=1 Tax=Oryza meridionalis TaxID=40149 RepID=A0A0E0C2V3_9ORYZ